MNVMKNIEIIPAILPKDFDELEQKLTRLKKAFLILNKKTKPAIQIDICDGQFVSSETCPWTGKGQTISQLAEFADNFDFELDLMVQNPKELLENWQNDERLNDLSRSGLCRIIMHFESFESEKDNLETNPPNLFGDLVSKLSAYSIQVGIAFNPDTLAEKIIPYLQIADFVQFMGIDKIGYQGQNFNPTVISKIQKFRARNPQMIISVDGGVNLENAPKLVRAGVNRLVIGSAIFADADAEIIAERIKKFTLLTLLKN
ncbi:MAG: hypothetical protein KAV41_00460 [Candidatus Pacebacteria bacterium]|nr:hypothetical protein [Candidatus Paceibacterota bacterium]